MNGEMIYCMAYKLSRKYKISEDFVIPKLIFLNKTEQIKNKTVYPLLFVFPQWNNNIKNEIIFKKEFSIEDVDSKLLRKIHLEFFEEIIENFDEIRIFNKEDDNLDTIVSAHYKHQIGILYLEERF